MRYEKTIEARASMKRYPEDVADDFEEAARQAGGATERPCLVEVTVDGAPVAVLVPPDLVEYALRHGWGR